MKGVMEADIGHRIESDGQLATVLFRGEIPPTKGEWLGVEWDDPDRGIHDGVHEGVRYFTAKYPKSGSFIRMKKANFGDSFMMALRKRYGLVEDDSAGVDLEEMFVLGKNQQTTVQVIGAKSVNKKQSQFKYLHEISLRDSLVSHAGKDGEINENVRSIQQLDLSKNLLHSWLSVADIVKQLVTLRSLHLSENKLIFPGNLSDLVPAFESVRVLYVVRMKYTWKEILQCSQMVTQLQELHVCFNVISVITEISPKLNNLKLLNFESNPFDDWSQVLKLASLPHLETLILNNTGIDRIELPDVSYGTTSQLFTQLKSLSISYNKIDKWGSINQLSKLSNLSELFFTKNPLLKNYNDDVTPRTIVIAKLGKLRMCNRSEINAVERKGAGLDYLKMFGREWIESGGHQEVEKNKPSELFVQNHPRYQTLVDLYGAPEDSELKEQSTALNHSLISIMIDCPQMPNKPPLKKKLPLTMTVQKLKTLVRRLFKADPILINLTYTSVEMKEHEIEMENDQKEIGFYSIEEGDTLHVKW